MLVFIDETWQSFPASKDQVCVLSAVAIHSRDFNEYSRQIWNLKVKHLGAKCGDIEIKGVEIFKKFHFRLEEKGILSHQLSLARDIIGYAKGHDAVAFASIVLDQQQIALECADDKLLERPFLYLFERINEYMKENYPDLTASLIFDDRNLSQNERISRSVSNFFHLSKAGRTFDRIIKVPFFAISSENIGIQLADMVCHLIGRETTHDRTIAKIWPLVKDMEFRSKIEHDGGDGKKYHYFGFKPIGKRKEAGSLSSQKGASN